MHLLGSARRCALLAAISSLFFATASLAATDSIPLPPFHACPAIGASASCQILLVVNPDRTVSVYEDSAQGPYDGSDDTLVGVWNQSTSPVDAITVTGPGSDLSGFDADGLCTFSVSGCPFGPTGYEGPQTSFVTDPSLPDGAEVDFTGGLASDATAYFSLEGALTSASLTAREGHLGGLQVALSTRDKALVPDPGRSAFVWLDVAVTRGDGSPAGGASITKSRDGKSVSFTANDQGQLHLLEPVSSTISGDVNVSASLGTDTASAAARLYDVNDGPVCRNLPGKPSALNPLKAILDLVGVPTIKPVFDGFIQAAGVGLQLTPQRYATGLSGETFTATGLAPLYELKIQVTDLKSNTVVSTSELFSRKSGLLNPLTGTGQPPLQQFARRMNCGPLA